MNASPDRQSGALVERIALLSSATEEILSALDTARTFETIGRAAVNLLPADAHAVWRFDPASHTWTPAWSQGIAASFLEATAAADGTGDAPFANPIYIADVQTHELLQGRRGAYAREGIRAVHVVPLRIRDRTHATIAAYYRAPIELSSADAQMATALGHLGSFALTAAEVARLDAISRAASDQAQWRAHFLARAGATLGSSLDYQETLRGVAQLVVPEMADWCAVDLEIDGQIKRVGIAHVDPAKVALAHRLQEQYPPDPASPYGVDAVLRSHAPLMMTRIAPELLAASAQSAEHLALLTELGLTSYMCVPLLTQGRAIGAMTFVAAESGREYTDDDLQFAMEVATRAAFAVVNARAYDEVRRANQLKDEFLATLSHELRTPLNAILGYARLLRAGGIPEDRRPGALQAVERNAVALTQIVEEVLDVSRIVAGKIRLNVQQVDLAQVVSEAVTTMTPAADAKGVRIHCVLEESAPPVSGDPDRLQQVAWNLLSNAVKFTPRGGRVQVRLERVNSHLEITVSDTGIGIAEEFLPHLFERFRQADSRPSRQHGGLGLGLAIARHLVELHGGRISASSGGEGQGATFSVRLPAMIVHPADLPRADRVHPRTVALGPPEPNVRLDGVHVLVVDDEPDAVALIQDILSVAGARVTTAGSARAALTVLERDRPDILVSDIGMPGMDGLEFIARVRGHQDRDVNRVAALALTAYARSEDRIRALQAGFQMHLAKPVNPPELVASVRALKPRPS